MKKLIAILVLSSFIFPSLSLAQVEAPQTMEEAKEIGEQALDKAGDELPGMLKQVWQNNILPVWISMWNWFKANIWSKISSWLTPEYEKRKEYFEENFDEEKEEMGEELKTEIPKGVSLLRSWWEKLKELVK